MPDTTIRLKYFLSNLSDFIMNVVCDLDATPEVVDELDCFKDQIDDIISDVYQEMGIDPDEADEVDEADEADEANEADETKPYINYGSSTDEAEKRKALRAAYRNKLGNK